MSLIGANPGEFAVTSGSGVTLAPNATTALNVSFTPMAVGSRSAGLVINSNADNGPNTVALTGIGISPLQTGFSGLNFGLVAVNASSKPMTITVTNGGSAPITISSVSSTGPNASEFTTTGGTGVILAPAASTAITVQFTRTATAAENAILTIGDSAGGTLSGALTGTGYIPGVLTSVVLVPSSKTNSILRYNGTTGEFIDAFIPPGSGGLTSPGGATFGPDGNLPEHLRESSEVQRADWRSVGSLRVVQSIQPGRPDFRPRRFSVHGQP